MGFHFKISLYGVGKCVTRLKRICTLTWYSSDHYWRMTAIIINKNNQKVYGKELVIKIIEDVLRKQMAYTARNYDSFLDECQRERDRITDLVCMFTCAANHWHPASYDFVDYAKNVHTRQTLCTIRPSADEAYSRNVARMRDEVIRLIEIFATQPTLVREPGITWRLDLYVYEPNFKNTERELIRLVGIVSDPTDFQHMKGIKVYAGHKDDYMVCRTPEALIFVMEQRLSNYLLVSDLRLNKINELPSAFYCYTNSDKTDLLGKSTSFKTYDEQQIKTHGMFVINYMLRDWNKYNAKNLASVLYRGITSKVLHIYSPQIA